MTASTTSLRGATQSAGGYHSGLGVLTTCDKAAAVAPLTALSKDKDASIAKEAAAKLAEVKR